MPDACSDSLSDAWKSSGVYQARYAAGQAAHADAYQAGYAEGRAAQLDDDCAWLARERRVGSDSPLFSLQTFYPSCGQASIGVVRRAGSILADLLRRDNGPAPKAPSPRQALVLLHDLETRHDMQSLPEVRDRLAALRLFVEQAAEGAPPGPPRPCARSDAEESRDA